jgi:hypothetical protein
MVRNGHITAPVMEGKNPQEEDLSRHIPEKLKKIVICYFIVVGRDI